MLRAICFRPSLLCGIVVAMMAMRVRRGPGLKPRSRQRLAAKAKKASIYDKAADVQAQVDKATRRPKQDNKRVLLMFGGDWCGWCHKLHELFASNAEIRKILSDEYVLVMVETAAPNAETWLAKCKDALQGRARQGCWLPVPGCARLRRQCDHGAETNPLEEGDHHDPGKVKDFLTRWTVTPQDAQVVLKEGLSRASRKTSASS